MQKLINGKNATRFPFWRERGNDDNSLSSLAVSPSNYEIFDFHTIDSPVFAGWWWKVECCMWIHGICCSSLFYKRGYSQNPPPVPLQEAHRPAILKLRHRPTSVQDVPTCEPLARTDHEPKAHLCMFEFRKVCWCVPSYVYFVVYLQFPLHLLYLMFNLFLSLHNTKFFLKHRKILILRIAIYSW